MTQQHIETTLRIAIVLNEATVLDDSHWQAFAKKCGLRFEKGAWEILNQNVSLGAFKDLMLMDLTALLPGGKAPSALEAALAAPVTLYPREIAHLLKQNQPDVAQLCHVLISQGLMSTDSLGSALDRAERDALNVYDVLVDQGLITPDAVTRAVANRSKGFSPENRVLLAGDLLIYNALVTREQWASTVESRAATMAPLGATLESLGLLTQERLCAALEKGLDVPTMDLAAYDLAPELVGRFPMDFMRRQMFMPLSIQGRHFEIATADPFNPALADSISLLTGKPVSVIYAAHNDLLTKFQQHSPEASAQESSSAPAPAPAPVVRKAAKPASAAPKPGEPKLVPPDVETAQRVQVPTGRSLGGAEPFVDNLSAVQLVSQIVESAIGMHATDIHIEPQEGAIRVRFRVDGQLHTVLKAPAEMLAPIASRIKVLAAMNVTERRRPQDGHCSFSTKNNAYDLRVSTLPSNYGEKIVMRVLDASRVITGLGELGLEGEQLDTLNRIIQRPHGLVLVTGPTGSGKTSTLYACVSTVNTDEVNIITIEDPVEYQLEGITQVEVDTNIDLTFANGLRSSLRQDPDVIMVGEVRDPDTAHTAVRAALTGHLVFSTLHANTAVAATHALMNMGVPAYLLASSASGIVAQRLVRVIHGDCKTELSPPKALLKDLGLTAKTRKKFYGGSGCDGCFRTGYMGRTGLFEVVEVNEQLRRAVMEQRSEDEMTAIVSARSMSMRDAGLAKVHTGVTTASEVLKAVALQ